MKLHGYYRSSAAYRVRIALNLKGIPYASSAWHLRKGEQHTPDFLALNPQGLVPALQTDDGIVTQSLAIIEYLDEVVPDPPLLPDEPQGRARVRSIAMCIACEIHPLDNLRVLTYLEREMGVDTETRDRWYSHWGRLGFAALESRLEREPETGHFCHGDAPTLADCCLVPQVTNAERYRCDLEPYPNLMRIHRHCRALDAFRRAEPAQQPDAE